MGNGQTERDRQEDTGKSFLAALVFAAIIFLLGFASATGFFYAHFGKVIHVAQQAGAEVQHVEKIVKEFNP